MVSTGPGTALPTRRRAIVDSTSSGGRRLRATTRAVDLEGRSSDVARSHALDECAIERASAASLQPVRSARQIDAWALVGRDLGKNGVDRRQGRGGIARNLRAALLAAEDVRGELQRGQRRGE